MKESKKLVVPEKEKKDTKGRNQGGNNSIPGVNTPGVELPAFNPPVPNRSWTAMKNGVDIDSLTPEERRDLYLGRDNIQ